MQLVEKIKQARLSAGLTQGQLAKIIGISRSTYQYWEQETPSFENLKLIEKALELPNDYFFVKDAETNGIVKESESEYGRTYLEESVRNLSETEKINARNIERLISLLEFKIGFVGQPDLPEPGTAGTVAIGKEKTGHKGRQ